MSERKKATIEVPSKGGEPPKDDDAKKKGKKGDAKDSKVPEVELSEEDLALKEKLEEAVQMVLEPGKVEVSGKASKKSSAQLRTDAIAMLSKEIRDATASMTSVPKPLKFLGPHFEALRDFYTKNAGEPSFADQAGIADLLSVLAMTQGKPEDRETLKYKLEAKSNTDIGSWGHEYVRALTGQIGADWDERTTADEPKDTTDLLHLVAEIVPFHMKHNAEPEAIDLLMETGLLRALVHGIPANGAAGFEGGEGAGAGAGAGAGESLVPASDMGLDDSNFKRVGLYLLTSADFAADADEMNEMLEVCLAVYRGQGKLADALRVSLRMNKPDIALEIMTGCTDASLRTQMAYMLARHRVNIELEDEDDLNEIIGNNKLGEQYLALARELDVLEPKTPEDIYKSHLAETGSTAKSGSGSVPDSAKANLASTFVNAFVNAGYCKDKLVSPEDSKWLYKNQEHGIMSAAASLGMILMWNIEEMTQIDRFLYSEDKAWVKDGSLMALGLCSAGVRNEIDPAFSLLEEELEEGSSSTADQKVGAIMGLALAYAGACREDVLALLMPYVADAESTANFELVSLAGLAIGMVAVGSSNEDAASTIADRLMEASTSEANHALARHLCLGLGLLFLGRCDEADTMLEVLGTIENEPIQKFATVMLRACAYAGTGNVLQVQRMLHICAEHPDEKKKGEAEKKESDGDNEEANTALAYQSMAVLGLGMVAMGEGLGVDMTRRMVEHLLQYGDPATRLAVPLALAIQHVSDPDYSVVDTLSKLSHDHHSPTAQNAIFALGIVGAGTNNSRIAGLLRQLTVFYKSEPQQLFMTRIAQGLLHAGKGLVTLNPFHSDRLLLSGVSMAGLLGAMVCGIDLKSTVHSKYHFLLYNFAAAMNPRMLFTVDEEGEPVQCNVRVGTAVDTVGQAGKPKTITGFQTHTTPVLLAPKERGELADDDEWEPMTSVLEGTVILRKKPEEEKSGAGAGADATMG